MGFRYAARYCCVFSFALTKMMVWFLTIAYLSTAAVIIHKVVCIYHQTSWHYFDFYVLVCNHYFSYSSLVTPPGTKRVLITPSRLTRLITYSVVSCFHKLLSPTYVK